MPPGGEQDVRMGRRISTAWVGLGWQGWRVWVWASLVDSSRVCGQQL